MGHEVVAAIHYVGIQKEDGHVDLLTHVLLEHADVKWKKDRQSFMLLKLGSKEGTSVGKQGGSYAQVMWQLAFLFEESGM